MNPVLVLMCSPHAGGVSDALAESFATGLRDTGWPVTQIPLREHPVIPCTGCGSCARAPHACVLAPRDEAEWLFTHFAEAPLVLLASPIFFYALPASFKGWIDRAQRFWAASAAGQQALAGGGGAAHGAPKPVLAVLAAGRPRGRELFTGALRTLRWFVPLLGGSLVANRVFRGLDSLEDIHGRPEDMETLRQWGRDWGRRLGDVPPEARSL